ncbi:MAG TPA: M28 family peptidase, partial [Thermoanaerobaculia bacterium]
PRPPNAAATTFSAARARRHLDTLAGRIGPRLTGTERNREAAAYLVAQMRAIPGIAVDVQEVEGVRRGRERATLYSVRNLLARVDGTLPGAILVSAHYDTKPGEPGAGDAAAPAAVVLEALRAIAASPKPRHPIVFLLNDGEELGLLGASGFLQHAWAEDVRAFINLDSAGPAGRPLVLQTGPENAWLASAWARSVPRPFGSVVAQDIFQSGVIPSDTDFRVYRDDGNWPGIDYVLFRNGWAYHTRLDTPRAVSDGSLQEMGSNVVAMVRALANRATLPQSRERAVYYHAGLRMLAYPESLGRLVAIALIALAVASAIAAFVRRKTGVAATLAGMVLALVALGLPLAAAVGAGSIAPLLGRIQSWYAAPGPAIGAWTAVALAVLLIAASLGALLLRRSALRRRQGALAAGAALVWATIVAAGTSAGLGSTYIATWWLAAAILTALAAAFVPRITGSVAFLSLLPPLALTVDISRAALDTFFPIAGRMIPAIPFDPILAAIAAAPLVAAAPQAAVWLQGVGGRMVAASLAIGFAAVALTVSLFQFPYSETRPQRVEVRHAMEGEASAIEFEPEDLASARAPHRDLFGGLRARRAGRGVFALAAPPRDIPVEIQTAVVEDGATKKLLIDVGPGPWYEAELVLPRQRVAGWTVWSEGGSSFEGKEPRIRLVNLPATISVTLRPGAASSAALEVRSPEATPELATMLRAMPEWTAANGIVVVRRRIGI